jgi:aspartate/tyrosine/aromatic aminotransferase
VFSYYTGSVLTSMCSLTAQETADKVLSQLKGVIRVLYSSPQLHGARVVATVLNDQGLTATWGKELKEMSDRIIQMRSALVKALADVTCPTPSASFTNWDHITSQIGMFAYTGLSKAQVRRRRRRRRIRIRGGGERERERERERESESKRRESERERRRLQHFFVLTLYLF